MKNSQQIISSLQDKPKFSKLSNFRCIQKIKSLFLPEVQRYVIYGYIKNNVLFFVLNHNAGKQEFDNTVRSVKSSLNTFTPDECSKNKITDIKAYVSHKRHKDDTLYLGSSTYETFPERSHAAFTNSVTDEKLHKVIENIRKILDDRKD
jgi:hypothetical protein